ncbi:alginate export family protein [uncultured Paraglaciecola sp.]|uniref:alginate export family protein n=1 Tax=uncultured Paraglaciecola sp. TaxID=1765024 RepID=UPI00262C3D5F|nr:alginate export family protein [uncultured Paraglaciecola sp.]
MGFVTVFVSATHSQMTYAAGLSNALTDGKASVNLNLRYESVEQNNTLDDANAFTLRTLISYDTSSYKGFSAKIEMEDSRIVLGQGNYTVGPSGYNIGEYSVIADPEHTELDQGYIQYKKRRFSAKLGRQVITLDGHRFVGHVGWRQDRQTFDALSAKYNPLQELSFHYVYITQRNRIFAQDADLKAKDHLFNAAYKTAYGTLTGYGYLLEVDNDADNALDTFGISFTGGSKTDDPQVLYGAEYASQSSQSAITDYQVRYLKLETGVKFSDTTAKLSYEELGSDRGAYGFSTPLATLHKFNGWSDQFLGTPAQGLIDSSVTLTSGAFDGVWTAVFHKFKADAVSDTVDDLGSELNLSYVKKYGKYYSAGIKYAAYSAGDIKTDTDKFWLWLGATF